MPRSGGAITRRVLSTTRWSSASAGLPASVIRRSTVPFLIRAGTTRTGSAAWTPGNRSTDPSAANGRGVTNSTVASWRSDVMYLTSTRCSIESAR